MRQARRRLNQQLSTDPAEGESRHCPARQPSQPKYASEQRTPKECEGRYGQNTRI